MFQTLLKAKTQEIQTIRAKMFARIKKQAFCTCESFFNALLQSWSRKIANIEKPSELVTAGNHQKNAQIPKKNFQKHLTKCNTSDKIKIQNKKGENKMITIIEFMEKAKQVESHYENLLRIYRSEEKEEGKAKEETIEMFNALMMQMEEAYNCLDAGLEGIFPREG